MCLIPFFLKAEPSVHCVPGQSLGTRFAMGSIELYVAGIYVCDVDSESFESGETSAE